MLLDANIRMSSPERLTKIGPKFALCCSIKTDENVKTSSSLSVAMQDRVLRREAMIILADRGVDVNPIAILIGCSECTVRRCIGRSIEMEDLNDHARSGRPAVYTEDISLKIIAFYCQTRPLLDSGRWTLQWAASYLAAHPEQVGAAPSKSTIHRILQKNGLKPHLSKYFLHITDPCFFGKMEHLIALYMSPPANLFFFDECPGIQILKRLTPDLRTHKTKARLEEFEYIRNGTMDVFAFLNYTDGKVYAECQADHKTNTLLDIFRRHVARFPNSEELHYVMDNLSSHRCYPFCQLVAELSDVPCPSENELDSQSKRTEWLQSEGKRIVVHFTPFHGSWLNLVEIWFGIMGAKVLGESYAGADALKVAFEAFLNQWNNLLAHPFRWSYDGKGLHEKAVKRFTEMLRNSAEQMDVRILTKMFMLMTNLLNDYFSEVPERIWKYLAETVSSKEKTLRDLIEREDGPRRKEKAEQSFEVFRTTLTQRIEQLKDAAA